MKAGKALAAAFHSIREIQENAFPLVFPALMTCKPHAVFCQLIYGDSVNLTYGFDNLNRGNCNLPWQNRKRPRSYLGPFP